MRMWRNLDRGGKLSAPGSTSHKIESPEENLKRQQGCANSLARLCEAAIEFRSCEKCGVKFPTESMLNRHKLAHNLNSWLRGRRPRPGFRQTRKHLEKRKHVCPCCDYACNAKASLAAHMREKHTAMNTLGEGARKSSSPSRKGADESTLRGSSQPEHRDKKKPSGFTCNRCDFACKRSSTLVSHVARNHRRSHEEECLSRKKRNAVSSRSSVEAASKKEPIVPAQETTDSSSVFLATADMERAGESSMITRASKKLEKKATEERCNMCDFKCTKKSALSSHKRQHRITDVSEVYSCNECAFKTCKKSSLYSHIKRKHKVAKSCTPDGQPQLFHCSQCDYKNKNKYELKVHVARKHTDDFKFSCETCGKKFKVKGDLTNHIRFSHKEQPVICDVCGKTCLNSNSLYVHQKFAHYKAKYECQVCKRRMVTQENLNEHMIRQHEKRENVVCEECGKTFSRNSRLKVHMRIHTGDKPYTCTICSKSFARRTALKQHLLIHTGIRPYICDICGKAFTQKPGLISHRKSHPGSHPPLPRVLIDHILNDVMNN